MMVYGDFNNVCEIGTDMKWSMLKKPRKHWMGFVKLSLTKIINMGKGENIATAKYM